MSITERVYYAQPYLQSIQAKVLSIEGEKVVLDRTICYPECGGQPGDIGTLGGCVLYDTRKEGEDGIVHMVKSPSFHVGDEVTLRLDWEHRHFFMCVHTAQHALSGLLFRLHQIGTVAVHDGNEILTIETDQGSIAEDVCLHVEDEANQVILEGHPVHYEEMGHQEAEGLGLRRSIKVEGDVRLVVIEGVDIIACGGVHVANTREIGLIQYVTQEQIRGHVRLVFRVGKRAVEEIRENRTLIHSLCTLHSATREDLLPVEEQSEALLRELKSENARLKEALARKGLEGKSGVCIWDISGAPFDLKDLTQTLDGTKDLALCAYRKEGERFTWLMAFLGSYRSFDFNGKRKELLSSVNGKGGGRPPVYQGMGEGEPSLLTEAFKAVVG